MTLPHHYDLTATATLHEHIIQDQFNTHYSNALKEARVIRDCYMLSDLPARYDFYVYAIELAKSGKTCIKTLFETSSKQQTEQQALRQQAAEHPMGLRENLFALIKPEQSHGPLNNFRESVANFIYDLGPAALCEEQIQKDIQKISGYRIL